MLLVKINFFIFIIKSHFKMDYLGTRRPVIPQLVQDINGNQVTALTNTVGTSQDTSKDSTVIGLLKSIAEKLSSS